MENGLYYCEASQATLGFSDNYKFVWDRRESGSSFAEIVESYSTVDEFGDKWISVVCAVESGAVPIRKMRYRHRCGDTGFEGFSENANGQQPDKELQPLFDSIMQDAWTWDSQKNKLICYADERDVINFPDEFFYRKAPRAPVITLHSPASALLEQLSSLDKDGVSEVPAIYRLQGVEKLKELFDLASECTMVIVWQLSNGINPMIISTNIDAVMKKLGALCAAESIQFKKVDSEENLPTW